MAEVFEAWSKVALHDFGPKACPARPWHFSPPIAGGATVLPCVDDSGLRLVSRFFRRDEATTLKAWTVRETLHGPLVFTLLLSLVL